MRRPWPSWKQLGAYSASPRSSRCGPAGRVSRHFIKAVTATQKIWRQASSTGSRWMRTARPTGPTCAALLGCAKHCRVLGQQKASVEQLLCNTASSRYGALQYEALPERSSHFTASSNPERDMSVQALHSVANPGGAVGDLREMAGSLAPHLSHAPDRISRPRTARSSTGRSWWATPSHAGTVTRTLCNPGPPAPRRRLQSDKYASLQW